MKKIVKLHESDLVRIVKRILSEEVDKETTINYLLDKMNRYGKESLSDDEWEMLKNPDSIESTMEDESSEDVHNVVKSLQELGLVNPQFVNFYEDFFEVYNIEGGDFDYFSTYDGFLTIKVQEFWDSNDKNYDYEIVISFEDDFDVSYDDDPYADSELDGEEAKQKLANYILDNWEDKLETKRIAMFFEDEDWD